MLWNSCEWAMQTTLKLECTADSGGYTMKWRRVKPKPCEVRRRWIVLGPGQENGSSSSWKSTPEESSWSTTSYTEKNTWNHEEADLDFCKINKKINGKCFILNDHTYAKNDLGFKGDRTWSNCTDRDTMPLAFTPVNHFCEQESTDQELLPFISRCSGQPHPGETAKSAAHVVKMKREIKFDCQNCYDIIILDIFLFIRRNAHWRLSQDWPDVMSGGCGWCFMFHLKLIFLCGAYLRITDTIRRFPHCSNLFCWH